jgi:transcriptional regulator with XRE-family HTH domain
MADINVAGVRGEYRRLTSMEVGVLIRAFREGRGINRAVLAADANMSEKTLERAEGGQGISEGSCRRIARALGLQEDLFVGEKYIPGPEEALRLLEQKDNERRTTHTPSAVAEFKGVRDVLPFFRADGFLADDQNIAEQDMEAFADLKESWWEWNAIASDIGQSELVRGAQSFLAEIRSFEERGYVLKLCLANRSYKDGTPVEMAVLVAFKKSKGSVGTPEEVWLPKRVSVGF